MRISPRIGSLRPTAVNSILADVREVQRDENTVLLNATLEPIGVASLQRAVAFIVKERAQIVLAADGVIRSNSLELTGNILAVAYQTKQPGMTPAGFELFDVSVPENPKLISFFDCSGPKSRGVHQVWFVDGEYIHCASGAPDFSVCVTTLPATARMFFTR